MVIAYNTCFFILCVLNCRISLQNNPLKLSSQIFFLKFLCCNLVAIVELENVMKPTNKLR